MRGDMIRPLPLAAAPAPLLTVVLVALVLALAGCGEEIRDRGEVPDRATRAAETVIGLPLTSAERELMRTDLTEQRESYRALRELELDNAVASALLFDPLAHRPGAALAFTAAAAAAGTGPVWSDPGAVSRPDDLNDLAFAEIGELAVLLRNRQVTSLELTELFLRRLQQFAAVRAAARVRRHADRRARARAGTAGRPRTRRRPLARAAARYPIRSKGFAGSGRLPDHVGSGALSGPGDRRYRHGHCPARQRRRGARGQADPRCVGVGRRLVRRHDTQPVEIARQGWFRSPSGPRPGVRSSRRRPAAA